MASVKITGLKKKFGELDVINDISLGIEHGEFVVFVGPSGCGKSTLLRVIAGLETSDAGTIHFGDSRIDGLTPADREIAMVFQSYALYPHMSVRGNMAFGLKMAKMEKSEIDSRVERAASMLQIEHLLDRMPKQLSGGQRQRVAIGRAITRDPKVFLFDEPLSNLDASLRMETRMEIGKLKESMPDTTMIYVTHDQVEAMTLADRIFVFNQGNIEQVGTPMELYQKPENTFVAGFIGSPPMNFIDASVSQAGSEFKIRATGGDELQQSVKLSGAAVDEKLILGARPEHIRLDTDEPVVTKGTIQYIEKLGENTFVYINSGGGSKLIVKAQPEKQFSIGKSVSLHCRPENLHIFDSDGNRLEDD